MAKRIAKTKCIIIQELVSFRLYFLKSQNLRCWKWNEMKMCICRDCVRGNPSIVGPVALLSCNQVGKKPLWKIPKLSSEQVQLLNFKDISVRNKRSSYMNFNLQPLKYCLLKLSSNSCQGLNEIGTIFSFCFQNLVLQIGNLFHSGRWKNVTCIKKLEITVSFVHN